MSLKDRLIADGRLHWLDIGCGGVFEEGFKCIDLFPETLIDERCRDRYFRIDMRNVSDQALARLGKFDFIRMQHTFEHFSWEDGQELLKSCAEIMHPDSFILITTPDLRVHVDKYLRSEYGTFDGFKEWAEKRIPMGAPSSFYFSVFAHSMPYESHQWCYDFEGLRYQLELTGKYKQIEQIKITDPLAEVPFTHNRQQEDVCILARRI